MLHKLMVLDCVFPLEWSPDFPESALLGLDCLIIVHSIPCMTKLAVLKPNSLIP